MDKLALGFVRCALAIDEHSQLVEAINKASTSGLSSLTDDEKLRVLDFPDPDAQAANISKFTVLSKSELLQRAINAPTELSAGELQLLYRRFWPDRVSAEGKAFRAASSALGSSDAYNRAARELKALREPLYNELEAKGLSSADAEFRRRSLERQAELLKEEKEEAERQLEYARPWVKRMWEEDGSDPFPQGKYWGYAIFYDRSVVNNGRHYDTYISRMNGALDWALNASCCGTILRFRWKMQQLEWPEILERQPTNYTDIDEKLRKFQKLREHFLSIQSHPPEKRKIITPNINGRNSITEVPGALRKGFLRNVFLVVNHECVDSTVGAKSMGGVVDSMWVWAVDPFYEDKSDEEEEASEASHNDGNEDRKESSETSHGGEKYRGFLRVRLQQIVNNFYEVRRFHEHEYSMEKLWEISQTSRNKMFVSVKDEEKNHWLPNRDLGSDIRPPRVIAQGQ